MQRVRCSVVMALLCVGLMHGAGQSATSGKNPAFEVASVKANLSGTVVLQDGRVASGANIGSAGGRFTAQNASLLTLVSLAYGIQEFRISGGPRWMRTSRFNVDAKAETAVDDRLTMLMLRSLLADRFGLSLRREQKELPAHVLLLAKKGPELQPTTSEPSRRRPIRYVVSAPADDKASPRIQLVGTASMAQLAAFLSSSMRSPVVDGTGLDGVFDIDVAFMSEAFGMSMKRNERDAMAGLPSTFAPPDSELAHALQTQLGLRFETRRRPIEVLVIDNAAPPSDN